MKSKIKIYLLELLLVMFFFFTLFASNIITRIHIAIFMVLFTILSCFIIKKRNIKSIFKKQVIVLMLIFAVIYLGIFYLLGLYYGFTTPKYIFNFNNLVKIVIPVLFIIISSEILRNLFLTQDGIINIRGKKINLSIVLVFIAMTIIDLKIYSSAYDMTNLNDFLMTLGFVLFASLSCNLLYNYITVRFGYIGIIIYRLITTMYAYIFPVVPDVYIFLRSFLRMIYPFIIYLILEATYAKTHFAVAYKDKKKNIFWTTLLFIIVTLLIMLISCEFKYGIIVIGSESMTGTINIGDAVVFEKYENEKIEKGQIAIFDYNGITTVHRIIEIRVVNGEIRYLTKGDSNKELDSGYRIDRDIKGLVKLKVKYIGVPTLWLRKLFNKK